MCNNKNNNNEWKVNILGVRIEIPQNIFKNMLNDYNNGMSLTKLSKKYPYSYSVISDRFKEKGIQIRHNDFYAKRFTCNKEYFSNINTPDKAYWLGFIYADGFLIKSRHGADSLGISIQEGDKNHLYKFREAIKGNHNIHTYAVTNGYKNGTLYCRILIKEQKIVDDLIKAGVMYNKTGKLQFIKNNIIKDNYMRDFIRGYFDGNGSIRISHQKNRTYFKLGINGTKEMLDGIKSCLPIDLSYKKYYERHPDRDNNNYDLDINKIDEIREVLDFMYKDANTYLERKYQRYIMFKEIFN